METYSLMLSIIVPIYNASKYLNRCIDSILNQGLDENDYEIILINDGSTDNSLSICNRYVDTKPSIIKVIDKLNEGVAAARNCGINHALGKYIYFIDADDYLIPNGLNYIITSFLDDSIDILSFRALTLDKNTKRTFVEDNNIEGKICKECTGKEFLYRSVQAFVFTSLYKRSFLQEHYLFFERISIGEDLLFNLKVYLENPKIRIVSSRLYRYDLHDESIIHRRDYPFMRKAIDAYQSLFIFLKRNIDLYSNSNVILSNGLEKILESQFLTFCSIVLSTDLSIKEIKTLKKQLKESKIIPLGKKNCLMNEIFRCIYLFPLFKIFFQKVFIPYILPHINRN